MSSSALQLAVVSSDGILRLDLDFEDAVMPNGSRHATVDGTETPKGANKFPVPPSDASQGAEEPLDPGREAEVSPQKKVIKPPMPPTKGTMSTSTPAQEVESNGGTEVCMMSKPLFRFMYLCSD